MKQKLLVALLGTALALPMAVQAQGAYVGVNVGRAEQKLSIDEVGSIKENSTGFKLYGGVDFTKNFGLELGYAVLGKLEESATDGVDTASFSMKPRAFYVAATGTIPLNDQFSFFGKAGLSANRTKISASFNDQSDSDTESETSLMFGIGAAYNFTKNLALVAEYENYGKVLKDDGADLKANMLSLGLRYKF